MRWRTDGRRAQRIVLVIALLTVASHVIGVAAPRQRTSEHFAITYETQFGASSGSYAQLVEGYLESAYTYYMAAGFELFPGIIEVEILETDAGELGAEYLLEDEMGAWVPIIEITSEGIMEDYLSYAYVASSLEDLVASTCAHELFHVIQDYHSLQGDGDVSELSFVEPHATAIQELVVPTANDYLGPALDLLLAPDGMAFFERSYDGGIFWVYFLDRFGSEALLQLMDSSARYDGRFAIDHALSFQDLTFFDVWADFALSLAISDVPDSDVLATLVPEAEGSGWWTRTRNPAQIPPVVVQSTWEGVEQTIETVNATNTSEYIPNFEDDPIGADLRIAHSYGIDILEITPGSTVPMLIVFAGDSGSEFRTAIASETSTGWTSAVFENSIALTPDVDTSRIRIVITRSEPGTGEYTVTLRPGS